MARPRKRKLKPQKVYFPQAGEKYRAYLTELREWTGEPDLSWHLLLGKVTTSEACELMRLRKRAELSGEIEETVAPSGPVAPTPVRKPSKEIPDFL